MKIRRPNHEQQRGAVAILVGLFLVLLLTVGALVIDLGRLWNTHSELQNAADAGAIAAVRAYGDNSLIVQSGTTYTAGSGWSAASTAAAAAAVAITSLDTANGHALGGETSFLPGYWNTATHHFNPSISTPGASDVAAAKVTVTPGTIATTLARVMGSTSMAVSASAVAVVGGGQPLPESGAMFPIAVNGCIVSQLQSYSGQIVVSTDQNKNGVATLVSTSGCSSSNEVVAQWTNLGVSGTGDSVVQGLVANPVAPVPFGTVMQLDSGAKNGTFTQINQLNFPVTVSLPVLPETAFAGSANPSGQGAVSSYVPFTLRGGLGGSSKYVYGTFGLPASAPSCCFSLAPALVQF